MKVDHHPKPVQGIGQPFQRLHYVRFGKIKAGIEHGIEQTLFAGYMMVQTRLREACGSRDVAHRSVVIAFAMNTSAATSNTRSRVKCPLPSFFLVRFEAMKRTYRPIGRLIEYGGKVKGLYPGETFSMAVRSRVRDGNVRRSGPSNAIRS